MQKTPTTGATKGRDKRHKMTATKQKISRNAKRPSDKTAQAHKRQNKSDKKGAQQNGNDGTTNGKKRNKTAKGGHQNGTTGITNCETSVSQPCTHATAHTSISTTT